MSEEATTMWPVPDPVINLDSDLRPVSVSIPCPATVEAVLGLPEPVTLPCGKLDGHDGEHEYRIGWTDRACPDCRGRGEIEDYEFNPFYSEHSGPVVDKCSACGGSGRSPDRVLSVLNRLCPVAAAAYRQGREDLEARIEELAEAHEIKASITESDRKARELDRRAELLRSLLTDKEDNNE